jgi:hypothetical protein
VELLVNDLSIVGQFADLATFQGAIDRVMVMRVIAKQFGYELYCHKNIARAQVTQNLSMPQAIQAFERNKQQAIMQWLTRHGPFWEDSQLHSPDDYLECNGEIVTETAVGEAAFCSHHGVQRHLISMTPSSWEFSPITVNWVSDDKIRSFAVINYWEEEELKSSLRAASTPISSWEQLEEVARKRFTDLTFSIDSFEFLYGHPFVPSASRQIFTRLEVLNRFKCCFDDNGVRTEEGEQIYQNHFTGNEAWFTDSSSSEKNEFNTELTFKHPELEGKFLFCSWHGKVNTPKIRIHFSWPVRPDESLYVVYVGPKITKR